MERKDFFTTVLFGSASLLIPWNRTEADHSLHKKIKLAKVFLAGFQYYDGMEVENLLETGMALTLKREPANTFDKYAIEVYCGDAKLGYLPRDRNHTVALLMDQGIEIHAEITNLDIEQLPYRGIRVEVWYT